MSNDECRKKAEARMSKTSELRHRQFRDSDFVIPSDFVIRHSDLRSADENDDEAEGTVHGEPPFAFAHTLRP